MSGAQSPTAVRSLPTPAPGWPSRIALTIPALCDGGSERVVTRLAERWSRWTPRVAVVTLAGVEDDVYALAPGVERAALRLARPARNPLDGAWQTARRVRALRRALVRLAPEVVVGFTGPMNVLTLLAARGLATRVIVSERNDPRHEPLGRQWATLRRLLYPAAAGVVVQTERVAGWARGFCPRVQVIPNDVEAPAVLASPRGDGGPMRLLAMGRLAPEKGFDLLLAAFSAIARRHPRWSLVIVGEGGERPRLEALVSRLGLEGRVSLPGRTGDTAGAFAAAHAFVLSSRHEGFPNVLLEAMAAGLPVVAFDCPCGPAEIVTHGQDGLLVPPGDLAGLGTALERLLASEGERARLGARAREVVTRYAPERTLALWATVLAEVAHVHAARP